MKQGTNEFDVAISKVRHRIEKARAASNKEWSADARFYDFSEKLERILDEVTGGIEGKDIYFAYTVLILVITALSEWEAALADEIEFEADDFYVHLNDAWDVIHNHTPFDSEEADWVVSSTCRDIRSEAFIAQPRYAYDLLYIFSGLVTKNTFNLVLETLDEFREDLRAMGRESLYMEDEVMVRLFSYNATGGVDKVMRIMEENMEYESVRQEAFQYALIDEDYDKAERFCLDFIANAGEDAPFYRVTEWYEHLLELYEATGDKEKLTELRRFLILEKHSVNDYVSLRDQLIDEGTWESEYPLLIEGLRDDPNPRIYLKFLSIENDNARILEWLKEDPMRVFEYGGYLDKEFEDECWDLYEQAIFPFAAEAKTRRHYKKLSRMIEDYYQFGGKLAAMSVISSLKDLYPRRKLMIEELDELNSWLERSCFFESFE